MKENPLRVAFLAISVTVFPLCVVAQSAGDYRTATSGNWSTLTTWERFNGSTWQTALTSPTSSDGVISIRNTHTVSVDIAITADQVVIEAGGTMEVSVVSLTINNGPGIDLTVYGTFRNAPSLALGGSPDIEFMSSGVYEHKFTATAGTIPSAVWDSGSTCKVSGYTSNSSAPSGLTQSFYNFIWNCPSQTSAIVASSDTIKVKGNFTVTSTGTGSLSALIRFDGTSQQSISTVGDLVNTSDLIINNAAGVSLTDNLSIDNLTFISGNLLLGNYDLTIGGTVTGAAAGQCIVTENGSTGKVVRSIAASGSFQFPVAPTTTSYNPITLALAAADPTDSFHVRIESGVDPSAPNDQTLVQRTMDITEGTGGGNNVTLTFQWITTEEGTVFTRYNAAFWHHNGSSWQKLSEGTLDSLNAGGPYTLRSVSTLSNFSRWSAGNSGGLPVEMTGFSAAANGLDAILTWSTATEVENAGWFVERRTVREDGGAGERPGLPGTWESVGFIRGAGTSSVPLSYSFTDRLQSAGRYAYRLKQVDRNGGFVYSHDSEIEVGMTPRLLTLEQNFPNPFNPTTFVSFTIPSDGFATVHVINLRGQIVAELFQGAAVGGRLYRYSFDASRLPSGTYYALLRFGNRQIVRKMVLLK